MIGLFYSEVWRFLVQWAGLYMRKSLCKVKRKVEGVCIYG